jgi:hypothetical protein
MCVSLWNQVGGLSAFRRILLQQQLSSKFANGTIWGFIWKKVSYPLIWLETGDSKILWPDILQEAEEKVHMILEHLKAAQSR